MSKIMHLATQMSQNTRQINQSPFAQAGINTIFNMDSK